MKTLCLAVLLLTACCCCCDALGHAVINTAPSDCCFSFRTGQIPDRLVSGITKTHRSCRKEAFVVETVKGLKFCFRPSSPWAQSLYQQLHSAEGSAQLR